MSVVLNWIVKNDFDDDYLIEEESQAKALFSFGYKEHSFPNIIAKYPILNNLLDRYGCPSAELINKFAGVKICDGRWKLSTTSISVILYRLWKLGFNVESRTG